MAERKRPCVYIVAGPNGAGKTTFARKFLPDYARCREFVNADLIASGLSPFSPEAAALRAGRLLLEQIRLLADKRSDFGFETTLSGVTYVSFFRKLKARGYKIHLFFLWLPSVEIALARIADRVRRGGHDIPEAVVRRRFRKGVAHLFGRYRPLVDAWTLMDNAGAAPRVIARHEDGALRIFDQGTFSKITGMAKQ
jgi:predicted ABC-type ATPase